MLSFVELATHAVFIYLGESVAISAMFDNRSSRSVIPYASLHQLQTFFANGKSRIRGTKFTVLTGWHTHIKSKYFIRY